MTLLAEVLNAAREKFRQDLTRDFNKNNSREMIQSLHNQFNQDLASYLKVSLVSDLLILLRPNGCSPYDVFSNNIFDNVLKKSGFSIPEDSLIERIEALNATDLKSLLEHVIVLIPHSNHKTNKKDSSGRASPMQLSFFNVSKQSSETVHCYTSHKEYRGSYKKARELIRNDNQKGTGLLSARSCDETDAIIDLNTTANISSRDAENILTLIFEAIWSALHYPESYAKLHIIFDKSNRISFRFIGDFYKGNLLSRQILLDVNDENKLQQLLLEYFNFKKQHPLLYSSSDDTPNNTIVSNVAAVTLAADDYSPQFHMIDLAAAKFGMPELLISGGKTFYHPRSYIQIKGNCIISISDDGNTYTLAEKKLTGKYQIMQYTRNLGEGTVYYSEINPQDKKLVLPTDTYRYTFKKGENGTYTLTGKDDYHPQKRRKLKSRNNAISIKNNLTQIVYLITDKMKQPNKNRHLSTSLVNLLNASDEELSWNEVISQCQEAWLPHSSPQSISDTHKDLFFKPVKCIIHRLQASVPGYIG